MPSVRIRSRRRLHVVAPRFTRCCEAGRRLRGARFTSSDRVIASLRDALPESWFIGVGIALSYMVGDVRRAPVLLRRVGLEWLFRLVQEPRRLGVRYVRDDLPFALWLLGRATTRRIAAFRGDT